MALVCCALLLPLGCGREPEKQPATSTTTLVAPSSTLAAPPTPSTRPPEPSPSTMPVTGIVTQEDARRFLEERQIDPGRVSDEVGEHMRHRFDPPAH